EEKRKIAGGAARRRAAHALTLRRGGSASQAERSPADLAPARAASPRPGARSARRGSLPQSTADPVKEQTMNPLLSALSRSVRLSRGGRYRKSPARANAGRKPRRLALGVEVLEWRDVPTAVAPPGGLVSWWTADNTAADLKGLNNAALSNVSYTAGEA